VNLLLGILVVQMTSRIHGISDQNPRPPQAEATGCKADATDSVTPLGMMCSWSCVMFEADSWGVKKFQEAN